MYRVREFEGRDQLERLLPLFRQELVVEVGVNS